MGKDELTPEQEQVAVAALRRAFACVGGQGALARELGISRQAVSAWRGVVPYKKARRVEAATRGEVSRFELRPDFYL